MGGLGSLVDASGCVVGDRGLGGSTPGIKGRAWVNARVGVGST